MFYVLVILGRIRSCFRYFWEGGIALAGLAERSAFFQILGHPPKNRRTLEQNFFSQCIQGLTRHFLFYEVRFVLLFFRTLLKK